MTPTYEALTETTEEVTPETAPEAPIAEYPGLFLCFKKVGISAATMVIRYMTKNMILPTEVPKSSTYLFSTASPKM